MINTALLAKCNHGLRVKENKVLLLKKRKPKSRIWRDLIFSAKTVIVNQLQCHFLLRITGNQSFRIQDAVKSHQDIEIQSICSTLQTWQLLKMFLTLCGAALEPPPNPKPIRENPDSPKVSRSCHRRVGAIISPGIIRAAIEEAKHCWKSQPQKAMLSQEAGEKRTACVLLMAGVGWRKDPPRHAGKWCQNTGPISQPTFSAVTPPLETLSPK